MEIIFLQYFEGISLVSPRLLLSTPEVILSSSGTSVIQIAKHELIFSVLTFSQPPAYFLSRLSFSLYFLGDFLDVFFELFSLKTLLVQELFVLLMSLKKKKKS